MESAEVSRAVAATTSIAAGLGLPVDSASVLHNSNKLALRLLPGEMFARVAPAGHGLAGFEAELAQRLAATGSPVAALDPRVEPRGYERNGFEVTLWTYYGPSRTGAPPSSRRPVPQRATGAARPSRCAALGPAVAAARRRDARVSTGPHDRPPRGARLTREAWDGAVIGQQTVIRLNGTSGHDVAACLGILSVTPCTGAWRVVGCATWEVITCRAC